MRHFSTGKHSVYQESICHSSDTLAYLREGSFVFLKSRNTTSSCCLGREEASAFIEVRATVMPLKVHSLLSANNLHLGHMTSASEGRVHQKPIVIKEAKHQGQKFECSFCHRSGCRRMDTEQKLGKTEP